ncbi:jg26908 [Pararge aegeria aegeria]|uniref:Jg26908 protein n=1 Tax=Pararge aegeria aegeria TaxID=348720 RepID=A0A8S4R2W7_9NEOP|nr:jg26908 [Pararge aegeria aegeria]
MILDCVQALCSYKGYKVEDAERLALEALPSTHNPLVEAMNNNSWMKLVAYLGLDAGRLVNRYLTQLKQQYIAVQCLFFVALAL